MNKTAAYKKNYTPDIRGFFGSGKIKTLEEIINSKGIEQEKIFLKNRDIFESFCPQQNERDLVAERNVKYITENVRVQLVSGYRLFVYYGGLPVFSCDVNAEIRRRKRRRMRRVKTVFYEAVGLDSENVKIVKIDDERGNLMGVICPLKSEKRNIADIAVIVISECEKTDIKMIKFGIIRNV